MPQCLYLYNIRIFRNIPSAQFTIFEFPQYSHLLNSHLHNIRIFTSAQFTHTQHSYNSPRTALSRLSAKYLSFHTSENTPFAVTPLCSPDVVTVQPCHGYPSVRSQVHVRFLDQRVRLRRANTSVTVPHQCQFSMTTLHDVNPYLNIPI